MLLLLVFLSGFAAAAAAPLVVRRLGAAAGWAAAGLAAVIAVAVLFAAPGLSGGPPRSVALPWARVVGLELALRLDGLAALFAVLVSAVGATVFVYSAGYLRGHPHLGRFLAYLLLFMAAMLGVVLADNLLLLYVCWELTTVSSWLLIGFEHGSERARKAAWQALMVTAAGGFAMLAGFVLLGQVAGTYALSTILQQGEVVRESGIYLPILLLVLAGAATKSALVPFHFWLPNAMEAPTPVSAYLHSAAMVKAGIYLLARLSPVLADTFAWTVAVAGLGAATAIVAAALALVQSDMKRLLAYTTISALGMMALALGIGGAKAVQAALALLLAHALYKGALFMVSGAVDHATGTRDLRRVRGLARALPWTAAASLLATASMVGLPPTLGFVSEDVLFSVTHEVLGPGGLWLAAAVMGSALYAGAGFVVGLRPFLGRRPQPAGAHAPGGSLWLPPLVLALAGVAAALAPGALDAALLAPATADVAGREAGERLALWHGVTPALLWGVGVILAGALLGLGWGRLRPAAGRLAGLGRLGPDRAYASLEHGLVAGAGRLDRLVQHGYLPGYLLVVGLTVLALVVPPLWQSDLARPSLAALPRPFDVALLALTLAAALGAAVSRSRVAVIACMSLVGYGTALIFATYGGADLAMTQVLVETLLSVLVVLLLPAMPRFETLASRGACLRDAALCAAMGAMVAWLLLAATAIPPDSGVIDFYRTHDQTPGVGRNLVNAILVNFRAGDTLGEITVLGAAALGAVGLMVRERRGARDDERSAARPLLAGPESLVLAIAARVLLPLLLVFALYLLLSGHHAPGGGFAAALVLAAALSLYLFANPGAEKRTLLGLTPRVLLVVGLTTALVSGALALLDGGPFLEARLAPFELHVLGGFHPGTPLLFDVGVCLVAAGALFSLLRVLEEHGPWRS